MRATMLHSLFTLSFTESASERVSSGTSSGLYCTPDSRSLTISRIHSFTTAGLNLQDLQENNKTANEPSNEHNEPLIHKYLNNKYLNNGNMHANTRHVNNTFYIQQLYVFFHLHFKLIYLWHCIL